MGQVILAFLLCRSGLEILEWAGWICLWTAGVFGLLLIITLPRRGKEASIGISEQ
jgi:hypothetical protein